MFFHYAELSLAMRKPKGRRKKKDQEKANEYIKILNYIARMAIDSISLLLAVVGLCSYAPQDMERKE